MGSQYLNENQQSMQKLFLSRIILPLGQRIQYAYLSIYFDNYVSRLIFLSKLITSHGFKLNFEHTHTILPFS